MKRILQLGSFAWLLIVLTGGNGFTAEPKRTSYYLIGNSLTWDTVPSRLSGDVQWHVDCGKSLPFISAHPEKPCVKTSTLWPEALREKQYDLISVQPHYGSTLTQDVETIAAWIKLQPNAVFVIHSGWARQVQRAEEFSSYANPMEMEHSPNYVRALVTELRRRFPKREFRQTLAQNLLAYIAQDIQAKRAPFDDLSELHRDAIHMTLDEGRYLMHNAMRQALGQPISIAGFEKIDPKVQKYLDGVLTWLKTRPVDKRLLTRILSVDTSENRSALIEKLSDETLQTQVRKLLPEIERAAKVRRSTMELKAEIQKVGGQLVCSPTGPQWLSLAMGDEGMEIFDVPVAVDLYNGNNPLKGRGGRNELVTDAWLNRLANHPTLRKLDLANCEVAGPGLEHVGKLFNLRELNLTLTPVSDEGLRHLAGLTELRNLGLASTQCNGTGFRYLKGLKKLASVNFHFTPLNDAGLQAISQIPISDRLWFAHTQFTDKGAAAMQRLTQLKRCGIGSKHKDSSGKAVAALTTLPLEDLALLDNQATPSGLAHAAKISTLRRLDVSHAPTVTDESMKLVAQMPKLKELKIGSAQVTDEGLQFLAASKSLKNLTLRRMKNITPAGVESLRTTRPGLIIDVQ